MDVREEDKDAPEFKVTIEDVEDRALTVPPNIYTAHLQSIANHIYTNSAKVYCTLSEYPDADFKSAAKSMTNSLRLCLTKLSKESADAVPL